MHCLCNGDKIGATVSQASLFCVSFSIIHIVYPGRLLQLLLVVVAGYDPERLASDVSDSSAGKIAGKFLFTASAKSGFF